MELHVALPNGGAGLRPTPDVLVDLAVRAEALGYRAIWVLDHLLVGPTLRERYALVYEPLVLLAHLAARTRDVRLGTSVIVLPMRNPFVLAKQVATLDQLSGGRVVLGLGVGYSEEEFRNVGADYRHRGRRTEEAIHLFRHLFSGRGGPFEGEFYGYEEGYFEPLPPQGEALPIMLGGASDSALERTGRLADMWQAVAMKPEEFRERAAFVRRAAGERPVEVGTRVTLRGKADEMRAQLDAWEAAGADHLAISFGPLEGFAQRMETLARAIV
jgi:probable F420-dependent oxidoreductase